MYVFISGCYELKLSVFLVFTGTYNTHGELTEVSLRENKKKACFSGIHTLYDFHVKIRMYTRKNL